MIRFIFWTRHWILWIIRQLTSVQKAILQAKYLNIRIWIDKAAGKTLEKVCHEKKQDTNLN